MDRQLTGFQQDMHKRIMDKVMILHSNDIPKVIEWFHTEFEILGFGMTPLVLIKIGKEEFVMSFLNGLFELKDSVQKIKAR